MGDTKEGNMQHQQEWHVVSCKKLSFIIKWILVDPIETYDMLGPFIRQFSVVRPADPLYKY